MNSQPNLNKPFGAVLKRLRQARNFSQEELAFRCSVSRNYLALLEAGENSPTLNRLAAIASALELPLPELLAQVQTEAGIPPHAAAT